MPMLSRFRVIQISDTHLVESPAFFLENWARLVRHVNALAPSLVIHTGDVSFDGASDETQLERASAHLRSLDCESLAVPGNHDVGELPAATGNLEPPLSAKRCDRFAAHFGQTRFKRDLGAWRLVGINGLLLGSGAHADARAEAAEWEQLESDLASAGERHIALFLHKPLYAEGPGDDSGAPRMLPRAASERLHSLIQQSDVRVVASGHLHEHRIATIEGVRHVWAPSTCFVTDEVLSAPIGIRRVGFVKYEFGPDDVEVEVVCPDDMVTHQFMDHPEVYPRFQEAARRVLARKRSQQA